MDGIRQYLLSIICACMIVAIIKVILGEKISASGILKLIAKTIISKYSGRLTGDSDMARVVSENIDDISVLVQIEAITPIVDKKAPINMINRPISID